MNIRLIISIFFFQVLLSSKLLGQTDIRKFADSIVLSIKSNNIDTVVSYYPFEPSWLINTELLNGIGSRQVFSNIYLIYKFGNKTLLTRIVQFNDSSITNNFEPKISISESIELPSDTFFSWIKSNISKIENESMLPFIYKIVENGISAYASSSQSEESTYSFCIYTPGNQTKNSIEGLTITEKFGLPPNEYYNLNYKYNCESTLYKLYTKFKSLHEKFYQLFKYTR